MKIQKRILLFAILLAVGVSASAVSPETVEKTVADLVDEKGADKTLAAKGVGQIAAMWIEKDGDEDAFRQFCMDNYIADPAVRKEVFMRVNDYLEGINGHFNGIALRVQKYTMLDNGPMYPMDHGFAAYNAMKHFTADMFRNRTALMVALNFPQMTIEEKEALGNDRLAWAYARMGDVFTSRPAEDSTGDSNPNDSGGDGRDSYADNYNIYMGHLLVGKKNERIFPQDMILLSHWNLRDEIKANYNKGKAGLEKQRTVYEVMKRIISQEIPVEVINSPEYDWNPYTNTLYKDDRQVVHKPEDTVRYRKMLDNYLRVRKNDKPGGDTHIDRHFRESMEVPVDEVEKVLRDFLASPELVQVGKIVRKRLGRKLEGFDIWYDGFKQRSNLDEDRLSAMTRERYPDAAALEADLPNILAKLGFPETQARYLAEKIGVDDARGSGHAWGAQMRGQKSLLRTRIPDGGMDYKGFNIAIHELGHNVEQTISLYDMDYYTMNGVPNTAFTEALAFIFQQRDLELLDMKQDDPAAYDMYVLDKIWSLYEISGVSLLDLEIWKWMYANPDASAANLREAGIDLAGKVWNEYYAPVFGIRDQTVLGVYTHMINYPLYLSAYAYGQMIEFQLDAHLRGRDFASEVTRMFRLGRLTPSVWMQQATGEPVSAEPILKATRKVLER